jgi:hypothetical protein
MPDKICSVGAGGKDDIVAIVGVDGEIAKPARVMFATHDGGRRHKLRNPPKLRVLIGGEVSPPTRQTIRLGDKPQSGFLFEAQFQLAFATRSICRTMPSLFFTAPRNAEYGSMPKSEVLSLMLPVPRTVVSVVVTSTGMLTSRVTP